MLAQMGYPHRIPTFTSVHILFLQTNTHMLYTLTHAHIRTYIIYIIYIYYVTQTYITRIHVFVHKHIDTNISGYIYTNMHAIQHTYIHTMHSYIHNSYAHTYIYIYYTHLVTYKFTDGT